MRPSWTVVTLVVAAGRAPYMVHSWGKQYWLNDFGRNRMTEIIEIQWTRIWNRISVTEIQCLVSESRPSWGERLTKPTSSIDLSTFFGNGVTAAFFKCAYRCRGICAFGSLKHPQYAIPQKKNQKKSAPPSLPFRIANPHGSLPILTMKKHHFCSCS